MSLCRRSREGAWIEIPYALPNENGKIGRSREGAWIEILTILVVCLTVFGRSREGAWIEILKPGIGADFFKVAPARERGLKCQFQMMINQPSTSLPRGSVD